MSTTGKILTGLLAFLPLFLFIGCFAMFFGMFFQIFQNIDPVQNTVEPDTELFMNSFLGIMAGMFLLFAVSLFKLIYFIIHINNNKSLDSNEKLVWILVGVFVGVIGFPIYWYMKIWKDAPTEPQTF